MKTVILCGGQGSRIRGVADHLPKPMIPIGERPILWHIMRNFYHYNFNEFILCLGYKGEVIKDYFQNYDMKSNDFTIHCGSSKEIEIHDTCISENWKITLANTGLNSMTGSRVKQIERYLKKEDLFFLTYGDGVGNIDINKLLNFHRDHGKILTITGVHPPGRFGELSLDGMNVVGFNEKPQSSSGRISGGFFVCDVRIFQFISDTASVVLEREPIEHLVKLNEVAMYAHDGFWHPMDTSRDYEFLNDLYEADDIRWQL